MFLKAITKTDITMLLPLPTSLTPSPLNLWLGQFFLLRSAHFNKAQGEEIYYLRDWSQAYGPFIGEFQARPFAQQTLTGFYSGVLS